MIVPVPILDLRLDAVIQCAASFASCVHYFCCLVAHFAYHGGAIHVSIQPVLRLIEVFAAFVYISSNCFLSGLLYHRLSVGVALFALFSFGRRLGVHLFLLGFHVKYIEYSKFNSFLDDACSLFVLRTMSTWFQFVCSCCRMLISFSVKKCSDHLSERLSEKPTAVYPQSQIPIISKLLSNH